MKEVILSLIVSNHFGVLTRVTNLFSCRGFNIKALAVGETNDPKFSRITILTDGDDAIINQIKLQLMKLEDVKKIADIPNEDLFVREVLLAKVNLTDDEIKKAENELKGVFFKINTIENDLRMVEILGNLNEIKESIKVLEKYDLQEVCRTGGAALQFTSDVVY